MAILSLDVLTFGPYGTQERLELQVLGSKAKEPIPAQYSQELRSLLDDILEKSSTTPGLKLLPSW